MEEVYSIYYYWQQNYINFGVPIIRVVTEVHISEYYFNGVGHFIHNHKHGHCCRHKHPSVYYYVATVDHSPDNICYNLVCYLPQGKRNISFNSLHLSFLDKHLISLTCHWYLYNPPE